MKRITILLIAFALLMMSSASVSARRSGSTDALVGNWDVTISAPGQELAGTLKLEKDGENYKGSLTTDLGEAPLKNIKMTESSFSADMTANVQGQTFEGTMTGKLESEKLNGEINLSGLGSIPYSGKKK